MCIRDSAALNFIKVQIGALAALLILGSGVDADDPQVNLPVEPPVEFKAPSSPIILTEPKTSGRDLLFIPATPTAPPANTSSKATQTQPAEAKSESHVDLSKLQQEKQDSMEQLHNRAAELARSWKARKVREALAALKEAERQQQLRQQLEAEQRQEAQGATNNSATRQQPNSTNDDQPVVPENSVANLQPATTIPEDTQPPQQQNPLQSVPKTEPPSETSEADPAQAAMADESQLPQASETPVVEAMPTGPLSIDGPIDRVALATSLFATQQFRECLQTLEAVPLDEISDESRDWCDYLAASCFRKLDQLSEAESRYRDLLNKKRTPWIAAAARWWLDHLNEHQKVRTEIAQLNSTVKAWKEEIDGLKTTP